MVGAVLSLFLLVTKRLYGKEWEWSIGQIKTCRKKQHVKIDDMKETSDLFCSKAAVGGNYNSTRDNKADAEHFTVTVKVSVSQMFLGWIMALDGVKIISPDTVVDKMKERILELYDTYFEK